MDNKEYIKKNIVRCEASYRGGGIEISLDELLGLEDYKMTAYQNYLGGGMLGSIANSYNFSIKELPETKQEKVRKITDTLNRYYHDLTVHNDEWENCTYEQGQNKPVSAF